MKSLMVILVVFAALVALAFPLAIAICALAGGLLVVFGRLITRCPNCRARRMKTTNGIAETYPQAGERDTFICAARAAGDRSGQTTIEAGRTPRIRVSIGHANLHGRAIAAIMSGGEMLLARVTARRGQYFIATMRNEFTAVCQQTDDWFIGYCPEMHPGRMARGVHLRIAAIALILETA